MAALNVGAEEEERRATVQIAVRPFSIALREPLATSFGTVRRRTGHLIRVTDRDGVSGYGEIAPLGGLSNERSRDTAEVLSALASQLKELCGETPPAAPREMRRLTRGLAVVEPDRPVMRSGIELALADLAARRAAQPLSHWLGEPARPSVAVNAMIGAVSPETASRRAAEAARRGFGTVKLKVGRDLDEDEARLAAVREALGARVGLRVDANGAWSVEEAVSAIRRLSTYGLEYVEQPTPARDIAALAEVRARSPVPIAADESLSVPGGAEHVLDLDAADVLVLKPSVLGGVTRALELAKEAQRRGKSAVVTTTVDTGVYRLGALHLAAALGAGGSRYAHGLATGDMLVEDLVAAPRPADGRLVVPTKYGLGVTPGSGFALV